MHRHVMRAACKIGRVAGTGGVITETSTHWIHTFNANGDFTPAQSDSVDALIVAGGGGGGASHIGQWGEGQPGGSGVVIVRYLK